MFKSVRETKKDMSNCVKADMNACSLMVASIHKTELPGDKILGVLAACCIPQLLGHPQQMRNKISIKSSQVSAYFICPSNS